MRHCIVTSKSKGLLKRAKQGGQTWGHTTQEDNNLTATDEWLGPHGRRGTWPGWLSTASTGGSQKEQAQANPHCCGAGTGRARHNTSFLKENHPVSIVLVVAMLVSALASFSLLITVCVCVYLYVYKCRWPRAELRLCPPNAGPFASLSCVPKTNCKHERGCNNLKR